MSSSSIGVGSSLTAQRLYAFNTRTMNDSLTKLATGQRINSGKDDPAGLITSESLRALLAGLEADVRSLERADSVASAADGALTEISGLLVEAQGLAVANANTAGMSDAEREANQLSMDSIISTVNRLAGSSRFNGDPLLDGSLTITAEGESITIDSVQSSNLGQVEVEGITRTLSDLTSGGVLNIVNGDASAASESIAAAIGQIATQRGALGAFQTNTIDALIANKQVGIENIATADSAIRDTDYALETARLGRSELLVQSSLNVLSIINAERGQTMKALLG